MVSAFADAWDSTQSDWVKLENMSEWQGAIAVSLDTFTGTKYQSEEEQDKYLIKLEGHDGEEASYDFTSSGKFRAFRDALLSVVDSETVNVPEGELFNSLNVWFKRNTPTVYFKKSPRGGGVHVKEFVVAKKSLPTVKLTDQQKVDTVKSEYTALLSKYRQTDRFTTHEGVQLPGVFDLADDSIAKNKDFWLQRPSPVELASEFFSSSEVTLDNTPGSIDF